METTLVSRLEQTHLDNAALLAALAPKINPQDVTRKLLGISRQHEGLICSATVHYIWDQHPGLTKQGHTEDRALYVLLNAWYDFRNSHFRHGPKPKTPKYQ